MSRYLLVEIQGSSGTFDAGNAASRAPGNHNRWQRPSTISDLSTAIGRSTSRACGAW